MSIYKKICSLVCDFEVNTGVKAKNLYVGENEKADLAKWGYENGYLSKTKLTDSTGDDRPEIAGLKIFVVNAENHLSIS